MERRHIGPLRKEGIGSAEPLFFRRRLPRGVRLQQARARPPAPRRIRGGMQGKLREVTREIPISPGPISGRVTPPIRRKPKWRGTGVGESEGSIRASIGETTQLARSKGSLLQRCLSVQGRAGASPRKG